MEQRWGLPLIAWPSRLRPNAWDLVALPLVLGVLALVAWGGMAMGAHYQIGDALPISLETISRPLVAISGPALVCLGSTTVLAGRTFASARSKLHGSNPYPPESAGDRVRASVSPVGVPGRFRIWACGA